MDRERERVLSAYERLRVHHPALPPNLRDFQVVFHMKRGNLAGCGSAVLLGSVGRLEPLSALSGTRHLEDEAIPEKKYVINCVCVAYIFRLTLWEHPTSCN